MTKIAILVYSDTLTVEALGKLSNALMLATEAIEAGDDLKIIFSGAGTKWIGELEKEDHKLHSLYQNVKTHITGACQFCSKAFGVKNQIEKAGLSLIDEYKEHPSIRTLIAEGYQIVTF